MITEPILLFLTDYIIKAHSLTLTLFYGLFKDLECELESLAISMQLFIKILTKISEIQNVVKRIKDFFRLSHCPVLIHKNSWDLCAKVKCFIKLSYHFSQD